ncbi:hypothetical protein [Streptomyces luteogriseus]|uniref:hypothetical protein n=1 Tax=Streptomyces luteogriseus TaxID=68233 RepID=UPI003795B70B
MAIGQTRRSASRVTWTACAVLVAGAAIAPQVITPAQPAAAADGDCTTYSVPTYVWEPATTANIASKRVLRKYMEWGPKSTDAVLLDTLNTASLPMTSKVFTGGGDGILYEATINGQVKAYKDNTATGGNLLTPVKTYSLDWSSAKRILTNGQWFLVFASDGTMDVYKQSSPTTGDGTLTRVIDGTKSSITTAISASDDAWMVNSTVQWLKDGTVQQSVLLPVNLTTSSTVRLWGTTEIATGVDATQAWAPGPGALSTQSVTADPDTTGQVRTYTTGPWTQVDDDVRAGIVGEVMADAGPCLTAPDPSVAPWFGTPPDDTGDPVAGEPTADTIASPSHTVTGTFTLGNGQPAPGLPVTVTAPDVGIDATSETKETVVGTTTTGADGSWSLNPARHSSGRGAAGQGRQRRGSQPRGRRDGHHHRRCEDARGGQSVRHHRPGSRGCEHRRPRQRPQRQAHPQHRRLGRQSEGLVRGGHRGADLRGPSREQPGCS